jgi:hypothetical protein
MSAYNNEEKDQLPPLIPLRKRRAEVPQAQTPSDKASVINNEPFDNTKIKDVPRKSPTSNVATDKVFSQAKTQQPNPDKVR